MRSMIQILLRYNTVLAMGIPFRKRQMFAGIEIALPTFGAFCKVLEGASLANFPNFIKQNLSNIHCLGQRIVQLWANMPTN